MSDELVKHMVRRFLGWKLPKNFNPDGGISFDPVCNRGHEFESAREPSGTNLFDATQAEAMVRYMLEGFPVEADRIAALEARVTMLERKTLPLNTYGGIRP